MSTSLSGSLVCDLDPSESQEVPSTLEEGRSPGLLHRGDEIQIDLQSEFASIGLPRPSLWQALRVGRMDPRQLELEEADRKALFELLRRNYMQMADAIFWSILIFFLAAIVLVPLFGWLKGLVLSAGLVSISRMVVERIRRV